MKIQYAYILSILQKMESGVIIEKKVGYILPTIFFRVKSSYI